jgi:thiosulfate reductase cytochrome b subunit
VVHFFFAWIFVGALLVWLLASLFTGHLRRDVAPRLADLRALPQDIVSHARFRFHHGRAYGPLQKLSYAGVLLVLMPLIVVTGLAMSPSFNATMPFLNDLLGGRQTARTIHFLCMILLVLFFVVHVLMVLAAGPINGMRSIITGWHRIDPPSPNQRQPGESQ